MERDSGGDEGAERVRRTLTGSLDKSSTKSLVNGASL
jgi:hypothetical protein